MKCQRAECTNEVIKKAHNAKYCSQKCLWVHCGRIARAQNPERHKRNNYKTARTPSVRFYTLRYTAGRRGIECAISFEHYMTVIAEPCHWCGGKLPETGHGVDRLINERGYVLGNCVSCCDTCNRAKRKMTPEVFFDWIERVYFYQTGRAQKVG
jgi:hypothetical protein